MPSDPVPFGEMEPKRYRPLLSDALLAALGKKAAEGDMYSIKQLYKFLKLSEGTCTCGR